MTFIFLGNYIGSFVHHQALGIKKNLIIEIWLKKILQQFFIICIRNIIIVPTIYV